MYVYQTAAADSFHAQPALEGINQVGLFRRGERNTARRSGLSERELRLLIKSQRAHRLHSQVVALQDAHLGLKKIIAGGHLHEQLPQVGHIRNFPADFQACGRLIDGLGTEAHEGDHRYGQGDDPQNQQAVLMKDAQIVAYG